MSISWRVQCWQSLHEVLPQSDDGIGSHACSYRLNRFFVEDGTAADENHGRAPEETDADGHEKPDGPQREVLVVDIVGRVCSEEEDDRGASRALCRSMVKWAHLKRVGKDVPGLAHSMDRRREVLPTPTEE